MPARCALSASAAVMAALAFWLPNAGAAAPRYEQVAAIFTARCTVCHTGAQAPNGLALDSQAAVLKGGRNGAVVVPGSARTSELVRRLRGERLPRMPMTGPPFLDDAEVALVEAWIDAGAPAGADPAAAAPPRPAPGQGVAVTHTDVAPILLRRCVKCHAENGQRGPPPEGYVLRTYEQTLAAADRARVVPGQPLASELWRRVRGLSRPRMPLDGPPWLGDDELALVERWIRDGARDAKGQPGALPVAAAVRLGGTLGTSGELDGLRFDARGARMDRGVAAGASVELRGRIEADGTVRASRLRVR